MQRSIQISKHKQTHSEPKQNKLILDTVMCGLFRKKYFPMEYFCNVLAPTSLAN